MKKLFYLLLLVPIIASGVSSTGVGVDKTTASLAVPMDIKGNVKIKIGINTVTWDFNNIGPTVNPNNPDFPPTSFPEYYEPSDPSDRYYQTIEYQVTGQAEDWKVTIAGTGDPAPACVISLSDIEYGDGAARVWTSIPPSATPDSLVSGSGNTKGKRYIYQDYRVRIDGNEINTSGSTTTIIYTIQIF